MKKVFLMLMVAVAFMACENVPGGNSGVPTKDAKAVAASTSGAVELLGKDAAAVDKALLAAGYEKVEMTYNAAPARLKKAFKEETNATYYYVFGYPKNVEKMTEEEMYKYQQELFGKGGAMSIVYVTFENNVLSNMQTQVAVGMSKKTNLLYTDISDLLFAELPKTDSLRQWRGAVYGAGEDGENQFTDHAAYVAKVAATNGIEAQEMGEGLYPETKTAKGYYALWYAPDPENPQAARVIAADNDSATTEEPTNNEVLYAMGMFSVAQSAYDPKPDQPTGISFEISVSEVQASSALFQVVPSDLEATYAINYYKAEEIAGLSDDSIVADIQSTLEYYAMIYQMFGEDVTAADLLSYGVVADTLSGLVGSTEYVIVAVQMDEELNALSKVARYHFTTAELQKVELTFDFELTNESVVVTPSDLTLPWDYVLVSEEEYAEYYNNDKDALAQEGYDYYGDYYAAPGDYEVLFQEVVNAYGEAGDFVLVTYGCNGGITSEVAEFQFTIPDTFVPEDSDDDDWWAPAKRMPASKAIKPAKRAFKALKK